jgi:hypothetical protein
MNQSLTNKLRHDILAVTGILLNLKMKNMQRKLLSLLFAAAAYVIYIYTKMTPE